MRKSLSLVLMLTAALSLEAQSKLTVHALSDLTEVSPSALQAAPSRDAHAVRELPVVRRISGDARLSIRLYEGADTQAVVDQIEQLDGKVSLVLGQLIIAQVPCARIAELEVIDAVMTIDTPHAVTAENNLARQATGVEVLQHASTRSDLGLSTDYTGKGVIIGIIDSGYEYQHYAFRDQQGQSRVRRVYQQEYDSEGKTNFVEYSTPEAISRLVTDPFPYNNPQEFHSHASHTTGTAAGSNWLPSNASVMNDSVHHMQGMAPDADLVLCSVSLYADDQSILQAADYIYKYAESVRKPAVINLSMGSILDAHDATTDFAYGMSKLTGDQPGRAFCVSAGNDGDSHMSLHCDFTGADYESTCGFGLATENANTQVWSSNASPLGYRLVLGNQDSLVSVMFDNAMTPDTGRVVRTVACDEFTITATIVADSLHSRNVMNFKVVCDTLKQQAIDDPSRFLFLQLAGKSGQSITVYSDHDLEWIQQEFEPNAENTISTMACNPNVISVGAWTSRTTYDYFLPTSEEGAWTKGYNNRQILGDICDFSSYGPDFSGKQYPEIAAPGATICSAMCNEEPSMLHYDYGYTSCVVTGEEGYFWGWMQGTSMSCPVVTGSVALMLQANPQLSLNQIRSYLANTASKDKFTNASAQRFGAGKLNALAAVQAVVADLPTTGIEELRDADDAAPATTGIYSVTGERVTEMRPGQIYLQGGRKVLAR